MSVFTVYTPGSSYSKVEFAAKQWRQLHNIPETVSDEKVLAEIDQYGLPWWRAGALVFNQEGKVLMAHEGRVQIYKMRDEARKSQLLSEGYSPKEWVDGDGGWNIPAGRLQFGTERFEEAAIREAEEETGWSIKIKDLIYVRKADNFVMPVFTAEAVSGPEEFYTVETREVIGIGWYWIWEIYNMRDAGLLRSPESVINSLEAYLAYGD